MLRAAVSAFLVFAVMEATPASEKYSLDAHSYHAALREAKGHPNEMARWRGLWSYSNGKLADARRHFERAAYYGDKPAQFVLSMMHAHGEGGARDPVLAYIWADLAAERGTSRQLALIREKLWLELSSEQQAQALKLGSELYGRYGDRAAMVRTNVALARFSRSRTGSRTGSGSSPLSVTLGAMGPFGVCATDDSDSRLDVLSADPYADNRVRLSDYWKEQDVILHKLIMGNVHVGSLERVGSGED